MAASTSATTSRPRSTSSASQARRPSSASRKRTAAPSASSGCSRRTCCGFAASTPSRSCAWHSSPFGRPTTRAGSSSGTATGHPPRSGPNKPRPCPWPLKRKAVSQNCGPVQNCADCSVIHLTSFSAQLSLPQLHACRSHQAHPTFVVRSQQVSRTRPLCVEILHVVRIRGEGMLDPLHDTDTVAFQSDYLLGIVGHQTNFTETQLPKDLRCCPI